MEASVEPAVVAEAESLPPSPSEAPEASARGPLPWGTALLSATVLHVVLLVAACFVVYANAYDHAFNLDSQHVAKDNPAIRTLANVPRFFTDPGTFSSLRPNVDYRPVLVISYALDYALGGYEMAQWHRTQVLLHALCTLGLYALCRRILCRAEGRVSAASRLIAFVAALVFAVHPTNCGVVDYISARSSLLTAAFLFPAILLYMVPGASPRYARTAWGTAILYTLAIFTKVEAVGCLAVFFLYDVWQTSAVGGRGAGFVPDVFRTLIHGWRGWLRRMWPLLAVTAVYFVVRASLMSAFDYEQASRRADVSSLDYARTQVVAWWHYVARWFLATPYVADDASFKVFRSFLEPRFLLAAGAWVLVAAVVIGQWRRRPYLTFVTVSALAMISPTSSIVPLAEMVNEHRPYFPLALLSLAWTIPAGGALARAVRPGAVPLAVGIAGGVVAIAGLGRAAWERNEVFETSESYWEDVLAKAPHGRAHVNYGLTFLARGDYETALSHFEDALDSMPYWHITHTNLALTYDKLGQPVKAKEHHDRAVQCDKFSGTALTYRGEFHLERREWAQAASDFEASMPKSNERFRNYKGLATARAGLGDGRGCYEAVKELIALDPEKLGLSIVAIATPFFEGNERLEAGLEFFQLLERDLPDTWWVYANLATLAQRLGRTEEAIRALARQRELRSE